MLKASARVTVNRDAAGGLDRGVRDALMDAMNAGFNASQQTIANEATDRGTLLQSGVPPQAQPDGSVVSGYGARHAEPVDRGSRPHWAPIGPLKGWARRVLGDEGAAYAVQQKIAREGTEPVGFMDDFVAAVKAKLRARGIGDYVVEAIGSHD